MIVRATRIEPPAYAPAAYARSPMPPTSVHFNGSVNLPDGETVMREISTRIPSGVRRMTDGETGDRGYWISFQIQKFLHDARARDRGLRARVRDRVGRAGDAPAAARRGRLGGHDRLAQPRLRRRLRRVVRDLRPPPAGGHDPRRRADAGAVPDAAGVDGGHDRAGGHAGRRRLLRARAVRRPRRSGRPAPARADRGPVGRGGRVRRPRRRVRPHAAARARRARPDPRPRAGAGRRPGRHAPLLRRLRPPALHGARVAADAGRCRERRRDRARHGRSTGPRSPCPRRAPTRATSHR